MTNEQSALWRIQSFGGMELLKAVTFNHEYPRHWHDTFVIEVVEGGANGFYCDGREYEAPEGSIILINPGAVHTGYPLGGNRLRYRSFYPSECILSELADLPSGTGLRFTRHVLWDPSLARLLSLVHQALEVSEDPVQSHSLLVTAFSRLVKSSSVKRAGEGSCKISGDSLRPAIEYIRESYNREITLSELAELSGLSPYHFLRCFKKAAGLPPFEFLTNIRIERARQLLARGLSIIETALATGFCDQSHFHRHFKRIVGVTPGQYRANSNLQVSLSIRH
ncbi:MAG TPA: AraC family transcriptional regulator [Acidobacteriota bacterium]|nr:AraC family transcriptional regulator [Acidobacteriota bacterium]